MMHQERKRYRESARLLEARLAQFESDKRPERKSINQVAIQAIKQALTEIGRKLKTDWWSKEVS